MSEREVSEQEIDDELEHLMEYDGDFKNISHILRLFAKLIFNIRYDIEELKKELLKVFREDREPISVEKGEDNTGELYS